MQRAPRSLSLSGIRDAKRPSLSRKKSSNTPRPDYIVGKTSQVKTYGLDFTQRSRDWTQGFDKHIQGVSACGPQLVAHVSVSHTPLWSLDPPVIIIAQTLSYVGR